MTVVSAGSLGGDVARGSWPSPPDSMLRTLCLLAFVAVPSLLCLELPAPQVHQGEVATHAPGPPPAVDACADCHVEIHREWAASLHAEAWENANYQKALKRRKGAQRDACLACHVPEPLTEATLKIDDRGLPEQPKTRELDRHLGIDCATCHQAEDGAMLGPFGATTKAHASRRDARFDVERVDLMCLSCHATEIGPVLPLGKDMLEAAPREPEASCVACHMQPVERVMATVNAGEDPPPTRKGRSHALRGVREATFLDLALTTEAKRRSDGQVEVTITNSGAGHRTPGLVGRKWTIAAVCAEDATNASGRRAPKPVKTSFEIRHDEALFPGAARRFELDSSALTPPLVLTLQLSYHLGGREVIDVQERKITVLE